MSPEPCERAAAGRDRVRFATAAGAALLIAAVLIAAALAGEAAAAPRPYRHALARVDVQLRQAIELKPVALGESLDSAEIVCELGEAAERRGEAARADDDWSALVQLGEQRTAPSLASIDASFARADSLLASLRARFERAWAGEPARVRRLDRGAALVHRGIVRMRAAMDRIEAALPAWSEHRCADARAAAESGSSAIPPALRPLNSGIALLLRL